VGFAYSHTVCINRIMSVVTTWTAAVRRGSARDGAYNSDLESFDFTSGPAGNGPHAVGLMAMDNWAAPGFGGPPLTITIDTTPPPMSPPMAMIMEAPYSSNPAVATVNWAPCPPDPESGMHRHQITDLWQMSPPLPLPIASQYVPCPIRCGRSAASAMISTQSLPGYLAGVNGVGLAGPATPSFPDAGLST